MWDIWIPNADQLSFLVERVQDDRVKVVSRDKTIQGWLLREQVVPLDEAIDYFGQVLVRDRRNTDAYWMREAMALPRRRRPRDGQSRAGNPS